MNPWERYATGPWQRYAPAGPQAQSAPEALGAGMAQGATLGFADELAAAVRATAPDWMTSGPVLQREGEEPVVPRETSKAGTWQQRYEEELAKTRGQSKANEEAFPILTGAGKVAGAVGTSVAALPAAVTRVAPTLLGNMAKMGLTGGALGAAEGFGSGEGIDDRLSKAMTGGVIGGGLGAAMPVAGLAGRAAMETAPGRYVSEKVVSPVARALAGVLEGPQPLRSLSAAAPDGTQGVTGPLGALASSTANQAETGAVDRLATALQRANLPAGQVSKRLEELGQPAMLADVDQQLMSAARMANTMPGATRSHAKIVLESRDRGAGPRLVGAFEGSEPPPSTFALGQAFDANKRAVGEEFYGAMRDAKLKISGEMQELLQVPAVKAAVAAVQADAKNTGTQLAATEIAHRVKQKLNDTAEAAFASGTPVNKADLRGLAGQWEQAFWGANRTARDADAAYHEAASLPEYMEAGRNFLRRGTSEKATESSAPALADLLVNAKDPRQVIAARAGATNAARETALEGTRPARALAQRVHESAPVRDKLVELYGPKQAGSIFRQAEAEGVFAGTSNDILRGSKTADKFAEVLDAGGAQLRGSGSGVTARVLERLDTVVNKLAGPNEAVRDALGRITLNADPSENARILRAIADVLERRARGAPAAAGSAGALGNMIGGN